MDLLLVADEITPTLGASLPIGCYILGWAHSALRGKRDGKGTGGDKGQDPY